MLKRILLFVLTRVLPEHRRPVWYRRLLGVKTGERNRYAGAINFGSEPYLVELGNDITLAQGVTFITHDGGARLFRKEYPGLNVFGKIKIGNNVFVGSSVTILPGVSIGDNVVIGACSLVSRSIPSNVVVVGVPARIIKSIDVYKEGLLKNGVLLDPEINRSQQIVKHCEHLAPKMPA
ncbi:acyltransferase [Azonexus sp.]|uniref:acyltransferase n=1 Tax=Azonexus sp. TaxID=1872668 RepID=UPI0035B1542D